MRLAVTTGNWATIEFDSLFFEGGVTVRNLSATKRRLQWNDDGLSFRADLTWNSSTQAVSAFTVDFNMNTGSGWTRWMNASRVNLGYKALTNARGALARADVFDFRVAGRGCSIMAGAGSDTVLGSAYADDIMGQDGNDRLVGRGGVDGFVGGRGADRITGGGGADKFRFLSLADRGDAITDFSRRQGDQLQFRSAGFGNLAKGELASSRFQLLANSGAATRAGTRFVFNDGNNALYYDRDGAGGVAAVKIATFTNGATLRASDITIV